MNTANRRGSALLVVLGMVAFIVVSAVAFSAYMRYSRLPSSFLRQTVASRLLVKAALANAIDEIDSAIGNNPHPGVGNAAYPYPRDGGSSWQRNSWIGRVYMGTNTTTTSATEDNTVTALNLEALAYVPPPLVNEVRYYSRRSRAGYWHRMNFDAGRYAFCAVDVSDYFDINALEAAAPRSSDMESRISLAYLFENHAGGGDGGLGSGTSWDSFMEAFRGKTKVPLVSIADWNLAMKNGGPFQTPFCNYVVNSPNNFYNLTSEEGEEVDKIRAMTFVTDSYFPPQPGSDTEVLDLSKDSSQPWSEAVLDQAAASLEPTFSGMQADAKKVFENDLPYPARVALYDYLDRDRVPISLAMPTVERVPMVCGVELAMKDAKLKLVKKEFPQDQCEFFDYSTGTQSTSNKRKVRKPVQYNLDGGALLDGGVTVSALTIYPFRHDDKVDNSGCNIDGSLRLFLSSAALGLRVDDDAVDALKELKEASFANSSLATGIMNIPLKSQSLDGFSQDMQTENDAVLPVKTFIADTSTIKTKLDSEPLFKVWIQFEQTCTPNQDGTYDWNDASVTPKLADVNIYDAGTTVISDDQHKPVVFDILDAKGAVLSEADKLKLITSGQVELRLNAAVALRVTMKNKDTDNNTRVVDMVPANGYCDQEFNNIGNWNGMSKSVLQNISGVDTPLLRFDADSTIPLTQSGIKSMSGADGLNAMATPRRIMIADPRYNYAPESWFTYADAINEANWLGINGAQSADGDIFLQTSDQCRLQSIYELANLPRLVDDDNAPFSKGANAWRGSLSQPIDYQGTAFATDKTKALNAGFMWKTYDPFGRYRTDGDGFEELKAVHYDCGFRVNPYSDSTNTMMAAFANTPHDWRCAYYDNLDLKNIDMAASAFNKTYAWNEFSAGAKLKWIDLEELAGEFMADVRANLSGNKYEEPWEVAFRNLGWRTARSGGTAEENAKYILDGLDLDGSCKVFNTDRKFLYGFWHDSFSARQQLFLIFVRAEPVMMGGGAIGQTPPQLGARAVALVWRDPKATSTANAPHRTRILFYRQFD